MKKLFKIFRKSRRYWSFLLLFILLIGITIGCKQTTSNSQENVHQSASVEVPLVLGARFKVKPEKRDLFLGLATAALEPTRQEPGNISYSFYEEAEQTNSFIYFEEWKSRADLDIHLETPYTKALLDKFAEFVDGQPNIRIYDIDRVKFQLEPCL